jgi:hypothetical protein
MIPSLRGQSLLSHGVREAGAESGRAVAKGNSLSSVDGSVAPARLPNFPRGVWPVASIAAVVAASSGVGFGRPFGSNQNTYLLHAVGPSLPQLQDDWFLHTTDPFPVFTAVARLAGGTIGFAVESFVLTLAAFAGLFLIAWTLLRTAPRTVRRAVPPLAVLLFCAVCYVLPHSPVPVLSWVQPFRGFGGQYLMSVPSLFQPSDCGALILLGAGIATSAGTSRFRRPLWVVAAALAVTTCALHPTYLPPLAVALLGFAIADLSASRTIRRFGWYAGTGVAAIALVVATNPVVRGSFIHHGGEPQRYLAFERIPHHTLVSHWDPRDAIFAILVIAGAGLTVWLTRAWWAATVLSVCLIVAVVTALTVEVTRNVALAMMFPWRITVLLVPVATITVIVCLVRLIAERLRHVSAAMLAVCVCLSLACLAVGANLTVNAPDPTSSRLVRIVRAAGPSGVGLIPLELDNVRLNTPAAVYVDWKSHPYASADLAEWQRRITAARAAETDDAAFCRLINQEKIRWVMLRRGRAVPACIAGWQHTGSEGVRIYMK